MKLLSPKQLDLHKLVGKDEDRKGMTGIFIDGNEATVTNGHYIVEVKNLAPVESQDFPPNGVKWVGDINGFILDAETAKQARKTLPKGKQYFDVVKHAAIGLIEDETGKVKHNVQTTDYETFNNYQPVHIDGKFPNTKQKGIIPDYKNEKLYQRVGVDASYLKQILAELEKYRKNHIVTLYVRKKDKNTSSRKYKTKTTLKAETFPLVVTAQDDDLHNEALAVIMPVRL